MPFNLEDYEPVDVRIGKFYADHPDGRINTDLIHTGQDGYIVKAFVWRDVQEAGAAATGYAAEAVTERGVNATSALENCETSAIGRALANLGYAAKGKRPSREEMEKTRSALIPPKGRAASGETSAKANSVPSADAESTQADTSPSASPISSGLPPDLETSAGPAYGEGADKPAGVSTYLSKDDRALLKAEYGGQVAALDAYRKRFGERIRSLSDITYEMRDEMGVTV